MNTDNSGIKRVNPNKDTTNANSVSTGDGELAKDLVGEDMSDKSASADKLDSLKDTIKDKSKNSDKKDKPSDKKDEGLKGELKNKLGKSASQKKSKLAAAASSKAAIFAAKAAAAHGLIQIFMKFMMLMMQAAAAAASAVTGFFGAIATFFANVGHAIGGFFTSVGSVVAGAFGFVASTATSAIVGAVTVVTAGTAVLGMGAGIYSQTRYDEEALRSDYVYIDDCDEAKYNKANSIEGDALGGELSLNEIQSDTVLKVYSVMSESGLSNDIICGVLGNAYHECSLIPWRVQGTPYTYTEEQAIAYEQGNRDGHYGVGIFQFTYMRKETVDWIKSHSSSGKWTDIEGQMLYMYAGDVGTSPGCIWFQGREPGTVWNDDYGNHLDVSSWEAIEKATAQWACEYEKFGNYANPAEPNGINDRAATAKKLAVYIADMQVDKTFAKSVLDKVANLQVSAATGEVKKSAQTCDGKCRGVLQESDENGIPTVPYIAQGIGAYEGDGVWSHPEWPGYNYPDGSNFAGAGCGQASMAMIFSYMQGELVTPMDWPWPACGMSTQGTYTEGFYNMADYYGVEHEETNSFDEAYTALEEGNLVVALYHYKGRDLPFNKWGRPVWTYRGHYVSLIGIMPNGDVAVGDPADPEKSYWYNGKIGQPKDVCADGDTYHIYYTSSSMKKMGAKCKQNTEITTEEAKKIIEQAKIEPSTGAGYCARWVGNVYRNALGEDISGNANDMWAKVSYADKSKLQPGMIIAVPRSNNTAGSAGYTYGHVGIYMGDGIVRENVNSGVVDTSLDAWIARYNGVTDDSGNQVQVRFGFPHHTEV